MLYRPLTHSEIEILCHQGCSADDWQNVEVAPDFEMSYLQNVRFSGDIRLGVFTHEFSLSGGVRRHSGVYNATLHNCTVGNEVLIENIANYIANYEIGDYCLILNTNRIVTEGVSSFGNGTLVSVLNETGGREVPIFNELSTHLAYIIALYRHFPVLTEKLKNMIGGYARQVSSSRGRIGANSRIVNAGTIHNVAIGNYAVVEGASRLENGSVNSCVSAPVYIGSNVIAEDFIVCSGAHLTDGAALVRCFVGQACHLGHLFSAHDSLFFSNCQCENGEACAVFAGPYTVTMHKSSLLIAGMFSFLNAGSGSNQSNHLYKLGPIHQGIVERGSKTTSDSYLLWPARIGAFSLIMGRHVSHPDTSDLPFSYLIEQNNQTYLIPGVNLRSVGTIRDAQKWPKRDKRTDHQQLDFINFNLLSPYTIQKMLAGVDILRTLQKISGETSEEYSYQSAHIKNSSLKKGIRFYSMAIHKFLGNSMIKRLENFEFTNDEDIRHRLCPDFEQGEGEWVDLSGLIAPQQMINCLIREIESGEISSVDQIHCFFQQLQADYYNLEWTWAWGVMQKWYGISMDTVTADDVIRIVEMWRAAVIGLDEMLYEDARKEFSMNVQTGFGVDGTHAQKAVDFEQVRGAFENNPFVKAVEEHIKIKSQLGEELIGRLKKSCSFISKD